MYLHSFSEWYSTWKIIIVSLKISDFIICDGSQGPHFCVFLSVCKIVQVPFLNYCIFKQVYK